MFNYREIYDKQWYNKISFFCHKKNTKKRKYRLAVFGNFYVTAQLRDQNYKRHQKYYKTVITLITHHKSSWNHPCKSSTDFKLYSLISFSIFSSVPYLLSLYPLHHLLKPSLMFLLLFYLTFLLPTSLFTDIQ